MSIEQLITTAMEISRERAAMLDRIRAAMLKCEHAAALSLMAEYCGISKEWKQPEMPELLHEKLLSPEQLGKRFDISVATLASWRSRGTGPAYIKTGRKVWYPEDRIEAWKTSVMRETLLGPAITSSVLDRHTKNWPKTKNPRLGRHKTKADLRGKK
jgi:hypothetical protein